MKTSGLGLPTVQWSLDAPTYERLRLALADVADEAVATIIEEVPSYRGPFTGVRGQRIREAVKLALDVFLKITLRPDAPEEAATATARIAAAAYDLGRGEARSGRTMDALFTAYRIGARVAWRILSREAVASGMPAATVGHFAEQVFTYIDDLSAASVAGHTDELKTQGRARERLLERLGRALAAGADEEDLLRRAERAGWDPVDTLTAVLVPTAHVSGVRDNLDQRTLQVSGDIPELDDDLTLLFVPDLAESGRHAVRRLLDGREAVIGPTRPWTSARSSVSRALRALELRTGRATVDTEECLVDLVLQADPAAYADLRAAVLAPLAGVRAASRPRLEETLWAWLVHQGHRDRIAAALFVHPQTVRYRMGKVRELFGDRLEDPAVRLALTVALAQGPAGRVRSGSCRR